jgi:predicted metal-binding membrane protein
MAEGTSLLQRLLRRDRIILVLCLLVLCGLAWAYLLTGAAMSGSDAMHMDMARMSSGGAAAPAGEFALVLVMWWVMMVAMMLPSATPAILLYERVHEHALASEAARTSAPAYVFAAGYLLFWLGFSVVAALSQSWLTSHGLISPEHLALTNPWASGAILLAVGFYQLSPLKSVCLAHCRSPAAYLARHWRPGWTGAISLGVRHGAFCVGCCWALMLLLFVGGVMNMLWIALISLFVLAEKLIPFGPVVGRASGILLFALGLTCLFLAAAG